MAKKAGLKPSGARGFVTHHTKKYPWAKRAQETQLSSRDNIFDHRPAHAMNKGIKLKDSGMITADASMNVYANFGVLGKQIIGTRDAKAKGSIWYAG